MVAISHLSQFIFLRTGKTASTSVEMALEPFCTGRNDPVVQPRHAEVLPEGIIAYRAVQPNDGLDQIWSPHMPAYRIQAILGRDTFGEYTKVITIRNPFDRMVSNFYWHVKGAKISLSAMSPKEVKAAFSAYLQNDYWLNDEQAAFIGGTYIPDFSIRYEHLAEDLGEFMRMKGLDPSRTKLPVTKRTRQDRQGLLVSDFYDAQQRDTVLGAFEWVFDRFDYSPDPKDADTPNEANPARKSRKEIV